MIKNGSVVSFEYTVSDDNGNVLQSNRGKSPVTYTHGREEIVPGLERGLAGMEVNETKNIRLQPQEAYGQVNPEAFTEVPKEQVPVSELQAGTILSARGSQVEDLFRRRLFSLFAWPLNLRGRICRRRFFAEIVEVCPVEPDEERKRPDEQGNKDEEQGGSKPSTLFLSSFLRHDAETKRKALVIRLVLEVMRRVDDADRAALRAHDHGLRRRASREKVNASQVVPVGHAGGGERDVASRQFLDFELLIDIPDAHLLGPFDFALVARFEPALEFPADAAKGRSGQNAFGRASDTEQQIDTGFRLGRRDRGRDIAVADQANARACLANFLYDLFVSRTGENDHRQIFDVAPSRFGGA